jgi:hypothetical protein
VTGARRLSQAISEGDGISIIALVADAEAAQTAEEQGAEGLAVCMAAPGVPECGLPVLFRADAPPEVAHEAGADACLIVVEEHDDEEHLEELHERARVLGLEIVADVHDEESILASLERIDPEIFLLSPRDAEDDEEDIDRILDLLPDVPAGKLAIADLCAATAEEVAKLERTGVDAVLVETKKIADLVGGAPPAP